MSHSKSVVTELIVTGFDDPFTASLAYAALARLQDELGLEVSDAVIVTRMADGNIAVQQTRRRNAGGSESATFWETIADQLFSSELSTGTATEAALEKGAAAGIDPTSASRVADQFRLCKSALLVRTRALAQREKVVGLLKGFGGELSRVACKS